MQCTTGVRFWTSWIHCIGLHRGPHCRVWKAQRPFTHVCWRYTTRASDSCLMLDYVRVINFRIIIIIIIMIAAVSPTPSLSETVWPGVCLLLPTGMARVDCNWMPTRPRRSGLGRASISPNFIALSSRSTSDLAIFSPTVSSVIWASIRTQSSQRNNTLPKLLLPASITFVGCVRSVVGPHPAALAASHLQS